jgi:hypothetical protein
VAPGRNALGPRFILEDGMNETRQERRRREREAEKAAGRPDAPPPTDQPQVLIRTLYVCTPDMVQEFGALLRAQNRLASMIHREMQHVHRCPANTPMQLGGILLNVKEELGEGGQVETPKEPSRIIHPGAVPPPPNIRG